VEQFTTIEMATNFRTIMPLMVAEVQRLLWLHIGFFRYLKLLHSIVNFKIKAVKSFVKHFDN
jgi:hypothetical protein